MTTGPDMSKMIAWKPDPLSLNQLADIRDEQRVEFSGRTKLAFLLIAGGLLLTACAGPAVVVPKHPTPDAGLQYIHPTDCQFIGRDNYDISFETGRVFWGTGEFPAQICFSKENFDADRATLIEEGLDPKQQLFINFLGYDACSGFTDEQLQQGMRPSRVSPHALAAQRVYEAQFKDQDLNDPKVRTKFNTALTDQFQQWVKHEWEHSIHAQNGDEPSPSLEATAITAEYNNDTTPVFSFSDPTFEDVRQEYPSAAVNGQIDYNSLWRGILTRINQTCKSPNN